VLALFPHIDRQRWVLWTPEGYYDCSPGAEDLIGWHVNRGKTEAADFFPASSFRAVHYRPDVVRRVLATLGTETALREADAALGKSAPPGNSALDGLITETIARDRDRTFARFDLAQVHAMLAPPVVELATGGVFGRVTLPAASAELRVDYRVRQTGAEPTTEINARFNGRKVPTRRESAPDPDWATVVAEIPPGMAGQLAISASYRFGEGDPAILRVERDPDATALRKPNLYLTVIGVSDLKMNDSADRDGDGHVSGEEIDRSDLSTKGAVFADLRHASKDASQVADCYRLHEGGLFGSIVTRKLLDREATSTAIREAIAGMAAQAGREDVALLYFSGHGEIDAASGYYLATYDADPQAVESTALTGQELSRLLDTIRGRTVLVLDACRSGMLARGGAAPPVVTSARDLPELVNRLTSPEQAVVVFSSSDASEISLEHAMIGGFFTQAFCEGIMGHAIPATVGRKEGGLVTCVDMQRWLRRRVPELLGMLSQPAETAPDAALDLPEQTPMSVLPKGVPDFALVQVPSESLDARTGIDLEPRQPVDTAGIPATPTAAIRRFLECSRGGIADLDPRLGRCFGGEVVYEGEKLPWEDLHHLLSNYNSAYEIRAYELVGVDSEQENAEGEVTVNYRVKVLERGKPGVPSVDTVRKMEAVLTPSDGGWLIVGLRTHP
jgi:Caspase domain